MSKSLTFFLRETICMLLLQPKPSFGSKSFQGGRRTERTFISTHLVEAGWARVPGGGAKLENEPHGQRTDAGSSAERITYTDPYINLDLKF